jgi:small-conductance mechanosensitive channel
VISKLLSFFIGHWLKVQKNTKKIPQYISNIVGTIILLIALMIILSILKVSITPILTSFGIAGLVVALSLQNTLVNFIAGVKIISEEKIKIGDFVDDGATIKGVVEDMSLNSTKIRNLNNNIIIVPNSKISDSPIINYTRNDNKIRIVVPVTISVDRPVNEIKEKLKEIAYKVFNTGEGIDKKREPEIWLSSANRVNSMILPVLTFNILITVTNYRYQFSITDELLMMISREF